MKTINIIALSSMIALSAFAADYSTTDYSTMSITELQALRGNVPTTDLAAFQSAMQTKVQALSTVERQALQSNMAQSNSAAYAAMRTQMQGQTMGAHQGTISGQQGSVGSPMQVGQTIGTRQSGMSGGRMH
jgi:hypothetical protein